jgi:hypothetical protein
MPLVFSASAGETTTRAGSSVGDRSSRSAGVTAGKVQYIIPMPDGNHSRNAAHRTTPSHRCRKISARVTI